MSEVEDRFIELLGKTDAFFERVQQQHAHRPAQRRLLQRVAHTAECLQDLAELASVYGGKPLLRIAITVLVVLAKGEQMTRVELRPRLVHVTEI